MSEAEAKQGMSYKGFFRKGKFNGYGEFAYGENTSDPNLNLAFVRRGYWKNNVFEGPGIEYTGESALTNKIKYIGSSIYDLMASCALNEKDEFELKKYVEKIGSVFL